MTGDLDWFELSYRDADERPIQGRAAVLAELGQSGNVKQQAPAEVGRWSRRVSADG